MHFPTWIDLKGQDSVPETVHHVVSSSTLGRGLRQTDRVSHHTTALHLYRTPVLAYVECCVYVCVCMHTEEEGRSQHLYFTFQ